MNSPRVLYVVTEPWYFANHRLDHARALLDAGFEVHVATRAGDRRDEIVSAGCTVHDLELARGGTSLAGLLREMRRLRRLVRSVEPDIVHAVALKPVAVSLASLAMRSRPSLILAVNGLGISAARRGLGLRAIRSVILLAGRLPRVVLLFQTRSDRIAVARAGGRGVVIPGVGVDTTRFSPTAVPSGPPWRVVYLGRAVVSKGLLELARSLRAEPVDDVEIHMYCAVDQSSPGALGPDEIAEIDGCSAITRHPATDDPAGALAGAHGSILASVAGEGVSKAVLESLASGRPVVASLESGSAEVVVDGETGLVFRHDVPGSLQHALRTLAGWSPDERDRVRADCRRAAEMSFSLEVLLPQVVALHVSALEHGGAHVNTDQRADETVKER